MPEAFRKQYARLWQAIITNDSDSLKTIAQSWGIRDSELFASFQLFRPYKARAARPATVAKVSRAEMLELQNQAKQRVVHMLEDSSKTPPELSLVGRHLNLVRSLNKALDSPVNRPRMMAVYAHRGARDTQQRDGVIADLSFNLRLAVIELVYRSTELWRQFNEWVLRRRVGGFEDLLESQMAQSVESKLGFAAAAGNQGDKFNTG
jgi:aarF domain-containing kinase